MLNSEQTLSDYIQQLYKKYIDLIGFMEYTKLDVKAVINFLYINYEKVANSQETFEEVINDV